MGSPPDQFLCRMILQWLSELRELSDGDDDRWFTPGIPGLGNLSNEGLGLNPAHEVGRLVFLVASRCLAQIVQAEATFAVGVDGGV